jgi:UDP-N-acetylmuramyl pentapeptide synthase
MNAKGELLGRIKSGGTAVLNADDPRVLALAERTDRKVLFYGLTDRARIRARDVATREAGCAFTLMLPDERVNVMLNIPGEFMVSNALAAAATGYLAGLSAGEIKAGLEAFRPEPGRMSIRRLANGIHMIDDTYNANPGSMAAALNTLSVLGEKSRIIFVAGDMKELGEHAASLHTDIGALAAETGVDLMFATGEFADRMAAGAVKKGMTPRHIMTGTKQEILKVLVERLKPKDWVLIKGSRSMAMEEIVRGLQRWAEDGDT